MSQYYLLAEARADGITEEEYPLATDIKLQEIIDQNEVLLEELIGKPLYVREESFVLDSDGSIYIRMPWKRIPLISVSALAISDTSYSSAHYYVYEDRIVLKTPELSIFSGILSSTQGFQNIAITASIGYASTTNKFKLAKQFVAKLTKQYFDDPENERVNNLKSERIGDHNKTLRGDSVQFFGDAELNMILKRLAPKIRIGLY